jgi:hypothetical protein
MTDHDDTEEPELTALELGTGYAGVEVTVLVDGRVAWHGDDVNTNYSVGLAGVVPLPVPADGDAVVAIEVGGRAHSQRVHLRSSSGAVRLRADVEPDGTIVLGPASGDPVF